MTTPTASRYLRSDGLYVVDGEIPIATKAERALADRVIGRYGVFVRRAANAVKVVPYAEGIAFIVTETRGDPNARSSKGALGLMQVLPSTFHEYRPGATEAQMLDPEQNIAVGFEYLARSHRKGLDLAAAASEYNAGPGPHPADNAWGMRMASIKGAGLYADMIVRVYNYVQLRTLRVMLRGDSVLLAAAPYIAAAVAGLPIVLIGPRGTKPVLHDAVVGDSIAKIAARLDGAIADSGKPDVIVEMAGSNDVPGNASPEQMARAEGAALLADARDADAVIVVAIPPQPGAPAARQGVPAAYNAALKRIVGGMHEPVVFIDPGLTDGDIGPDRVHPTSAGDRKIGEAVADALAAVASISREITVPGASPPWYRHPVTIAAGIALAGGAIAWRVYR